MRTHIEHRPTHEMQVDYAGTQMHVVDTQSGEVLKIYIFVACLPYSGELYAEGAYDTKEQAWIEAYIHAFSFFGGTPAVLVPDNLAQGVTKNSRDELVLNEEYRRMAEYYGCAVVPARPRKPRDKGAVESALRLIEQNACAPLRDRVFVSLADLNGALLDKVRQINEQPFQKKTAAGMRSSLPKKNLISPRCQ